MRLEAEVVERVDRAIHRIYTARNLVAPSRSAQLEKWVMEGLERAEQELQELERP